VRIHLAHTLGESIDMFLQHAPRFGDLRLLSSELARPLRRLELRLAPGIALTHLVPEQVSTAEQGDSCNRGCREGYGVRKIDVARTTLAATEKDDIHAEHSRKLDSIAIDRLSETGSGPRRTTATDEMLSKKLFITGDPAVIAHAVDRWLCVLTFR
jgi:hypothetical protein